MFGMENRFSERDIRKGRICPHCFCKPQYRGSSEFIYGSDHGPVWYCPDCVIWVGCHRDENKTPLGRLSGKGLRTLKTIAHHNFDKLWKNRYKLRRNENGGKGRIFPHRKAAYSWLRKRMDIPKEFAHIGMFDEGECREVIRLSKEKLKKETIQDLDGS